MNLSSQLFREVAPVPRPSDTMRRLAMAWTVGDTVSTLRGENYRVLQKRRTLAGVQMRLASLDRTHEVMVRVGAQDESALAHLYPVSRRVHRVAALLTHIAFDGKLSEYVLYAIRHAGLPVDPDMKWAEWLNSVFRPALRRLTSDATLIDDAISQVVFKKLFEMKILEKSSLYSHFDANKPSLAGKPLEKKVSAYLCFTFKLAIRDAVRFVKAQLGPGTKGQMGQKPTAPLYDVADDEEYERAFGEPSDSEDERLATIEVTKFGDAFKEWIGKPGRLKRQKTVEVMRYITDPLLSGVSRADVRDDLIESGIGGRDGQPYNKESFKKLIAQWSDLIQEFAQSEDNQYADTSISRSIIQMAEALDPSPDPHRMSASLKLADTGQVTQDPYSSTTNPTIVVEPAPPPAPPQNPNVTQQQGAAGSNANGQPPRSGAPTGQMGPGEQDYQQSNPNDPNNPLMPPVKKPTIQPEIPGVNHV